MILRPVLFAVGFLLASLAAAAADTGDRIALVIGVGHYLHVPPLDNTIRDATLIADTLRGIGFKVIALNDPTQADLVDNLATFAFQSETADLALIYFAGHGVEVQGENYLIPADALVKSNADVQKQSVSLSDFLAAVDHARKMRVVILDSCRNNPFPDLIKTDKASGTQTILASRGLGGLAAPSPDRGTLVAYAARDGQVAFDGGGQNSPFAIALHDKMSVSGLEISLMFRQVRDEVLAATENLQEPHTYGSLPGIPFYLSGAPASAAPGGDNSEQKSAAWSQLRPDQADQLQALASAGDARAMLGLAMMQLNPASPRYKPDAAAALLARAAAAESPEAEYELAKLYEKGIGVPENQARALELYQDAASKDFPDAVNDMGFFQYNGALGLPIDQTKALALFRHAADLDQPEAMVNVASFIDKGFIAGLGPAEAANYLYKSIRGGSKDALGALTGQPDYYTRKTWAALQAVLAENGFYKGKKDGAFGPATQKALRAAFGLIEASN